MKGAVVRGEGRSSGRASLTGGGGAFQVDGGGTFREMSADMYGFRTVPAPLYCTGCAPSNKLLVAGKL